MKFIALIIGAAVYCTNAIRIEPSVFHLKENKGQSQGKGSSQGQGNAKKDEESSFGTAGLFAEPTITKPAVAASTSTSAST